MAKKKRLGSEYHSIQKYYKNTEGKKSREMLWYAIWIQIVHSLLQNEFQREYKGKEGQQRTLHKVE